MPVATRPTPRGHPQRARWDVASIAECISGRIHPLAILIDREVTLSHGMEHMTEKDDTRSLVCLEEAHNGSLELADHLVRLEGDATNIILDGAEESIVDARAGGHPS